jgi:hypothetical protein
MFGNAMSDRSGIFFSPLTIYAGELRLLLLPDAKRPPSILDNGSEIIVIMECKISIHQNAGMITSGLFEKLRDFDDISYVNRSTSMNKLEAFSKL